MLLIDLIDQYKVGAHGWSRFLNAEGANFDRVLGGGLHQQHFVNWRRVFDIEKIIMVDITFKSMYETIKLANCLFLVIVTLVWFSN